MKILELKLNSDKNEIKEVKLRFFKPLHISNFSPTAD